MNRPQRGELKRRGALAIFLLSAAIIISAAMAAFMHYAANLRADSEQALLAVARLKKAQIENVLTERISDGAIFAQRTAVWRRLDSAGASPAPQPDLDAAITQTREAYGYRAIVLFDRRGRPVYPAADARFDELVNAAASAAIQSRQPAFVDMHRVAGNALAYGIVHPAFRGGNRQADVIGSVYIEMDPAQQLLPLVAEWPGNSPSAESILVRRDGNEAVFLATLRHKPEARPLDERRPITDDRVLAVRALQAPAGAIRGAVDYRDVPVIGVSVRINRTHWMLLSKIDQAEVDQTLHHLAWIIGSLAALFVVLAAGISYLFWRTKRQEQAAAQEGLARQYTTAIETAIDGYMQLSPDGRIINANSALARLTGRSVEKLQTMTVFELDADMTNEQIRTALQAVTVKDSLRFTTRWRKSDGTSVDIDLSAIHVPDEDNSRGYIHCFTRDITQALALTSRLERSMKGTLQAVARMVDLRDPYTAGHERRVGLIAAAIGREMGWDDEHCGHLEMVGLVHDIGKIAVPAEILSKPTKLNANEFAMIKGHAESGYEILQNVQFDLPVADIVRQHHERLDGSGYPQGLKGDAILPEARVLAVADVLESMSTHRPYRPALGVDAALEELQKNSGILYDGKVVDAVVRLIREKGFVLPD